MRRIIIVMGFIMMLALTIAGTVYAFAFDITSITADDFQTEEPKVDHGSNNDYGNLSDTFRDVAKMDNENFDAKTLDKANKEITSFTGMLVSIIIYLIFAMTAFTTACDLLYIGFPPIRPYLYDGGFDKNITGQSNAHLLGRYTGWTDSANDNYASAGMHGANAQGYAQRAQQRAMMGDMQGARNDMHTANLEQLSANRDKQWGDRFMQEQAQSDARRAQYNQQEIQNAQRRANNNAR